MYLSISICIIKIHPLLKVQREITTWRILCLKILLWQQTFALFPASPPSSAKSSCLRSTIIVIFIVDKLFDCPTTLTSLPVIWREEGGRGTKEQAGGGREVPKDDEDDNGGERGRRERKKDKTAVNTSRSLKQSFNFPQIKNIGPIGRRNGKRIG